MSQPAVPPRPGPPPSYGPGPYPPQPHYLNQPPPQQYRQPPPQQFHQPQPSPETRKDVAAAWAARLELGMDYEEHIAAGLADDGEVRAMMTTIRELNALDSSMLVAGQELFVPVVD